MSQKELDQERLNDIYEKFFKLLKNNGDSIKRLTSYDTGVVFEFYTTNGEPKVWWISPEELNEVVGKRSGENAAKALLHFFTEKQMFQFDCELSSAIDQLGQYIMRIVGPVFALDSMVVKQGQTITLYLLFKNTDLLDDSKLTLYKDRDDKEWPAFCFKERHLRALIGYTRREISQKVFSWMTAKTDRKEEKRSCRAELTTLEEVRETFSLEDFIASYQSGDMDEWLMRNGKTMMLKRMRAFQIPRDDSFSRIDALHLCEVFFPKWDDLPVRLQQALQLCKYDDCVNVSDDLCHLAFSQLARYCNTKLRINVSNNSQNRKKAICFFFLDDDNQEDKRCMVSSVDMSKLFAKNPQEKLGQALYDFIATKPFVEVGRDLRYTLTEFRNFIIPIVSNYYNLTNSSIIRFDDISIKILFADYQPLDDPHLSMEKNNKELCPCYTFDKKQLQSLCGLSRFDVADKILKWLEEANLNKMPPEE